jgi:hypothetical protein
MLQFKVRHYPRVSQGEGCDGSRRLIGGRRVGEKGPGQRWPGLFAIALPYQDASEVAAR